MPRSNFSFPHGEELTKIGASWFVSYMYYEKKDVAHKNWENVSAISSRKSRYNRCRRFHKEWLQRIIGMEPKRLDRNYIELTGAEIIEMAKELLLLFSTCGTAQINSKASFQIHISYQENIKLKELADLLNTVDLSVNDYYRDCGISNSELSRCAAVVDRVESGSILLGIIVEVVAGATAALLAEYILRRIGNGRRDRDLHIQVGDNSKVNIFIDNENVHIDNQDDNR